MKRMTSWATLAALLAAGLGPARAEAKKPDLRAVAERVVGESAGVKEGDLVLITGDVRDVALVEEIAVAVARHGGHPVQLLGRERTGPRYYAEVPERYDAGRAAFFARLAEIPTVLIGVGGLEQRGLYDKVPASRLAAVSKAFQPVGETYLKRNVRQVYVDNGLYPTKAQAQMMGLGQAELARLFWSALASDPRRTQANGAAVAAAFGAARQARLTHPNGTDLRFGVEGRPVILSDGVITPERAAQGGAAGILYLPAGEALLAPVPGTAEGKVVIDRMEIGAGRVEKLTWTFAGGKLVGYGGKPSAAYTRWKELYEAGGVGKEVFAGVDLGLHPGVKSPPGKPLLSYIPAGMVTVSIGDDTNLGGTNSSPYGSAGFLPGATLELDGKPLVRKGVLQAGAK